MRGIDFTSLQSIVTGLIGLALVTLIGMGLRLLVMMTVQQRRERANRQINERLRALMAAYKTLGGSFTGDLMVDPRHLRDIRKVAPATGREPPGVETVQVIDSDGPDSGRSRRIRDAVEAALADIILLGTEAQVRLAEKAARELVAGRAVPVHDLVVSLRDFIREALDLDPIPAGLDIPRQGPVRPSGSGAKAGGRERGEGGGSGRSGGDGIGGGGMSGGGMVGGGGLGSPLGTSHHTDDDETDLSR